MNKEFTQVPPGEIFLPRLFGYQVGPTSMMTISYMIELKLVTPTVLKTINCVITDVAPHEIKCRICGVDYQKKYLLENKLYWCQMCIAHHVFSSFHVSDFGPFESVDNLKVFYDEL